MQSEDTQKYWFGFVENYFTSSRENKSIASNFLLFFLEKSPETDCSLFEKIIQFLSLDVLGAFGVQEKVFNFNFSIFFTHKRENPRDVPLWLL